MRWPRKFSMARSSSRAQRSVQRCAAEPGPMRERWLPAQRCTVGMLQRVRDTREYSRLSLQFQSDHSHKPVGHLPVALELGGMRDQELGMIKIDQRLVVEYDLGQFLV